MSENNHESFRESADSVPQVSVSISALVLSDSPRQLGEDPEHTRTLIELAGTLPPIAVHRPTMRVIDGMHRVRAALLAGHSKIVARLYDCSEDVAFIMAVRANVTHGLPLVQSDRRAAAQRILHVHPDWSDRAVAGVTGLSDKTIGTLRGRSSAEAPQSPTRLGRDGRPRPMNTADQRRHAAELLDKKPDISLREVARLTGLAPATARDVRDRLRRNEDPVPPKYRGGHASRLLHGGNHHPDDHQQHGTENHGAGNHATGNHATGNHATGNHGPQGRRGGPRVRRAALDALRKDPSLRLTESGRYLIRWLHMHTVEPDEYASLIEAIPPHWVGRVADLARSCAQSWLDIATELQRRADHDG
jgi:ParB-like chromosome segregation protein Spo0J